MRMRRSVRWLVLPASVASVGCGGPPGKGDPTPAAPNNVTVVAGAGVVAKPSVQAHRVRNSAVAYDPSGGFIATAGGTKDGTAAVWAASDLAPTASFAHGGRVAAVAISPDGSTVATSAGDGTVTSWDALDGTPRFGDEVRHDGNALSYSADGSRLAHGSGVGVDLYDAASGERLLAMSTGFSLVLSVDIHATGSRIAAGGLGGVMWLWDAVSGNVLHALQAFPSGQVESMAFTPDGTKVVSGVGYVTSPASFAVWDVATGAELARRDANAYGVFAVAFVGDGSRMISVGRSPMLVWDTATWAVADTIPHEGIMSMAVASGDHVVVSGWGQTDALVLDATSFEVLATIPVVASDLDYHAASGRVVVANGAYVQVWEVTNR